MNPNFDYLTQLANGDLNFFEELKQVMVSELPEERNDYESQLSSGHLKEAASAIHKIKHKVGMLGMEESYKELEAYEHALRANINAESARVLKILNKIFKFLEIP